MNLSDQSNTLVSRVIDILDAARSRVVRHVNSEMVLAYWMIGREIVLALQGGETRADYGTALLAELSRALTSRYGRGFSVTNIKYFRLFYQAYANRQPEIRHELRDELHKQNDATLDVNQILAQYEALQGFSGFSRFTRTISLA